MRIDPHTRKEVQDFLRRHLGRPDLELPPIRLHSGIFAWGMTRLFSSNALTLGRNILLRSQWEQIPTSLLVHETVHVLQYEQIGFVPFLCSYAAEYWRFLRVVRGFAGFRAGIVRLVHPGKSSARVAAYLAIKYEREARAAHVAYLAQKEQSGEAI